MFNKRDQDLFLELINNSRQSNRQLSKKIGYTKETIASRISFLENSGFIKSYSLRVNYDCFNFKEYNIFIKFQNFSDELSQEFFDFLISHSNTTWIGKCFGSYDSKISFLAKNDSLANLFIKELYEMFSSIIQKLDLLVVLDKYKAPSNFFISTLFDKNFISSSNVLTPCLEELGLTNQDKEIIFLLGQNPKQSYVHIGNTLNLTAETISYKLKKFEENGILNGTSIVVDGNKFNKIWGIGLFSFRPNKILELKYKIRNNPSVTSYVESLGVWNVSITFFASSLNSLYEEYNIIKSIFGKEIINSEFVFILDFYKYPKVPKCILE